MRLWIDLANSPHVPFFAALIPEFRQRGHHVEITARDYAQTVELAQKAGLTPNVIGGHGGGRLTGKAGNLVGRAASLARWARGRGFDLAVSHNSYAQIAAASGLGITTATLMDYEHQPANHLAFRLASKVIVPHAFPESSLRRYGATKGKVRRYHGTKEDVYLAGFLPDPNFRATLANLGIGNNDMIVIVRPPASEALYHRFENELLGSMLEKLTSRPDVKVVLLARTGEQRREYAAMAKANLIQPESALDGANLIAAADLIISAGGTMNREAAALGVPAATIYAGEWAAIDEQLVNEGRLRRINSREDVDSLPLERKSEANPRRAMDVRNEVIELILTSAGEPRMKAERIQTQRFDAASVRVAARAPAWVVPSIKAALVVVDILLSIAIFAGAFYLRQGSPLLQQTGSAWRWTIAFAPYGALLILVSPIRILTLAYYDLYRLRGEFSFVEDSVRVFKATATGTLLIVAAAFLYRGGFQFRAFSYARAVFVLDFVLALAGFLLLRFAVRGSQMLARRHDLNLIPTLVVGRGNEASSFISEIRERPELGYRIIGVLEKETTSSAPQSFEGFPVVGDLKRLPDAIIESGANEVIITDPTVPGEALFDVMMRVGRRRGVEFRIAPSLFNFLPRKTEVDQIGALPMITLFRSPLSSVARVLKRTSDLIIALTASLIALPFSLLLALLIKLDSKGPVFYKQERVGMDGRVFLFYKFRTMRTNADDASHREFQRQYIAGQPEIKLANDGKPVYKLQADPRITRVGRWLRRLSLDELPQLLNVLRGDMSVVGPRPPIPYEVEAYELWHRKRLDMKPGMTGLWQVSGRNRLPFDEMVRLDLFYIENWSLLLDLKIILRTLPVMLRGDAY